MAPYDSYCTIWHAGCEILPARDPSEAGYVRLPEAYGNEWPAPAIFLARCALVSVFAIPWFLGAN